MFFSTSVPVNCFILSSDYWYSGGRSVLISTGIFSGKYISSATTTYTFFFIIYYNTVVRQYIASKAIRTTFICCISGCTSRKSHALVKYSLFPHLMASCFRSSKANELVSVSYESPSFRKSFNTPFCVSLTLLLVTGSLWKPHYDHSCHLE
jgi:hypothetical protein